MGIVCSGRSSGEVDLALGEQVKDNRLATSDGRIVLGIRLVDQPSLALAIELRSRSLRDDHVDLTIGMAVIRALDIIHQDDVNRKTVGLGTLLDDAAESDAAMLTIAQPACIDSLPAKLGQIVESLAARRKTLIEKRLQIAVEILARDAGGNRCHRCGEILLTAHEPPLPLPRA